MGAAAGGQAGHGTGDAPNRVTDYEQTVAVINMLTDVRFRLAAFVPIATGAAVALIRENTAPLTQFVLGVGGLVFVLGIVLYDLRNNQHYNNAIGRAQALERGLFERFGGDHHPGLFGSRADSLRRHQERGTHRFLRMPVRHSTGLMLVYTATVAAWVWVVFDAVARRWRGAGAVSWQPGSWLQEANHAGWAAAGIAGVAAVGFGFAYLRHDSPKQPETLVRLTCCLRRRPDITHEEFERHWREEHAALVAKRARVLGIRRYVQVRTADADGLHRSLQLRNGGSPEPFDGIAEVWFDSYEAYLNTGARQRAARAELLADERAFVDLAHSPMFFGEEHVVVSGSRPRRRRRR